MKKQVINLSSVAVMALALSGCMGGGLTVPVKERSQDVSAASMAKVAKNAPAGLKESLSSSKYSNTKTLSLDKLQDSNKKLYDLILPIAQEAQKMYKQRELPEDIVSNGSKWLNGDINSLEVTLTETSSGKLNGRYTPFNNLLVINYSDSADQKAIQFILAHEFAHALALHISEDRTAQDKALDGSEDAANLGLDIAINEAYKKLNKDIASAINLTVEKIVFKNLFTQEDLEDEKKIVKAREGGMMAQAAIATKQQDKLDKLGINLDVPLKTKMTMKYLISSGLDATGAIDALKGGLDFASANVMTISGHPKEQELEADSIALALSNNLNLGLKDSACKMFNSKKPAGVFDQHPSHADRKTNLGCK
jgi:hypothetical protein